MKGRSSSQASDEQDRSTGFGPAREGDDKGAQKASDVVQGIHSHGIQDRWVENVGLA